MTDSVNILAVETATSACSAALRINGEIAQRLVEGNNVHSQQLLSMIAQLLDDAGLQATELDAVAAGRGPGSFTGLRIGVGVAQGIAFAANCPMISVSSLQALASQVDQDTDQLLVGIDARMQQIYWARFSNQAGQLQMQEPIKLSSPQDLVTHADPRANTLLAGNAWSIYAAKLGNDFWSNCELLSRVNNPRAAEVLQIAEEKFMAGETVEPGLFQPEYVRNKVAQTTAERASKD